MNLTTQTQKTMSSIEITKIINDMREEGAAVLAHSDFMKKVVKVLGEEVAGKFSCYYKAENGKQNPCYHLPKREAHLMVMSENYKVQAAIYDRMESLEEAQKKPMSQLEILAQSAMALVEHDQRIAAQEVKIDRMAAKVEQISVDLRNGVPHGFISRQNARSLYAKGLSQVVFEDAMTALSVPKQNYISFGNGYSTSTYAYQEDHIQTAIAHFIRDLEQVTKCKCFSRVLNRRVDYIKMLNYGLKDNGATTGGLNA